MSDEPRLPLRAWWTLQAGGAPEPVDPWTRERTSTCESCATRWRDAAEGRRGVRSLRLHADCRKSLVFVGRFAADHAYRTKSANNILPALRSLVAAKRAGVRS